MIQIVYRAGERSEVKHSIDAARNTNRITDVLLDKFERGVFKNMFNIREMPGDQIIQRNYLVPLFGQAIAQV